MNSAKKDMRTKVIELHNTQKDIILLQETKLQGKQDLANLRCTWVQVSHETDFCTAAIAKISGGAAILLSHHASPLLTNVYLTLE